MFFLSYEQTVLVEMYWSNFAILCYSLQFVIKPANKRDYGYYEYHLFFADIFIASPNLLRANFAQSGKLMTRLVINKRIRITMTWQWTWLPHEVNDSIMQNTNNVGQLCNTIHCRYQSIGFFWVKFRVAR